ncbi:hypothetical protein DCAR_0830924 [Daucus carota subsp. sativus]|uniref:Uncharacterized protein n=1 Tax=Daucus carota subsp. sativus TaxID=79200 RepID=A0A175YBB6_DAUCS|nr:hypothetical protein DCAR_0830924 [Daucus carota subsp. sativus]
MRKNFGAKKLYLARAKGKFDKATSPNRYMGRMGGYSEKPKSNPSYYKSPPVITDFKEHTLKTPPTENDHSHLKEPIHHPFIIEETNEITQQDTNFELGYEINIPPSEEMIKVAQTSVFLRTAKNETVQSVTMIAEGLGARNLQIRGITGTTFIAYFTNKEDLECLDRDFLEIGFMEVRDVTVEELLPARKTWVEVRGLPLMGWTEINFKTILEDLESILQYIKIYDEEGFYQHPKFFMETSRMEEIKVHKNIILKGKKWRVRILEVQGDNVQVNDILSPTSSDFAPSQNPPNRKQFNNSPITPITIDKDQPETVLDVNTSDKQAVNKQAHVAANHDNGSNHNNGGIVAEPGRNVIVLEDSEQSREDDNWEKQNRRMRNLRHNQLNIKVILHWYKNIIVTAYIVLRITITNSHRRLLHAK